MITSIHIAPGGNHLPNRPKVLQVNETRLQDVPEYAQRYMMYWTKCNHCNIWVKDNFFCRKHASLYGLRVSHPKLVPDGQQWSLCGRGNDMFAFSYIKEPGEYSKYSDKDMVRKLVNSVKNPAGAV